MSESARLYELVVLGRPFAICRLGPKGLVPDWVDGGSFWSVARTADELSIICEERLIPAGVRAERGFSCLKVVGPLGFSEIGILAALSTIMAASNISIFAVSTYDTDYLLVREPDLPDAIDALRTNGYVLHF